MLALIQLSETVAEEEVSGLPLAISLGVGTFLLFALLLFAVSRLNPDR
ncbi:MAG: hypothetical protein WBC76_00050 [Actinomycetes bacterium]|jgi:hypothetical protein|nr:hypothetical protein [Actinomycetes bacterium]